MARGYSSVAAAVVVAACVACGAVSQVAVAQAQIEHFVVLMMENRAFDHMLGYMHQTYSNDLIGLKGTEFNPIDPKNPAAGRIYVSNNASYVDPDPGHSIPDTTQQVFGGGAFTNPAPMDGFVANAKAINIPADDVMACFSEENVPVISTLVREFAVIDQWFASVPGPTEVNRLYANAATSHGMGTNNATMLAEGIPSRTIYESLAEGGKTFGSYFELAPTTIFFDYMRQPQNWGTFHLFDTFAKHVSEGTLPNFSWLEPRYYEFFGSPATDQHPSHDVSQGELLMKNVYETLRNSSLWEKTVLLITYDEHGGFMDAYPTPLFNVPNPDGLNSTNPPFEFNRLGVRVPAIVISPWVNKGIIEHGPNGPTPTSHYEHSSIPATVKKVFNLTAPFLTARDAWAGTFDHLWNRTTPRTDCPMTLPTPPLLRTGVSASGKRPQHGFQKTITSVVAALNGDLEKGLRAAEELTEEDAGMFVKAEMEAFMTRIKQVNA